MKHLLAALILLFSNSMVYAELIPIEHFAKHAKYENVIMSPTGEYLAVTMRNKEGRLFVSILRLKDNKAMFHFPPQGDLEFFDPVWANNERIIVQTTRRDGPLGTPTPSGELTAFNFNGKKLQHLSFHKGFIFQGSLGNDLNGQTEILHLLPNDPNNIIVSHVKFGNKWVSRPSIAYKMNVYTGTIKRVARSPSKSATFVTNSKGHITHSIGLEVGDENFYLLHKRTGESWKLISRTAKTIASIPHASMKNGSIVFEEAQTNAPNKLYLVNLSEKKKQLIYKHSSVDPSYIQIDPTSNTAAVVHFDPDYPDLALLDPDHPYSQLYPTLYQTFNGKKVVITSSSKDYTKFTIKVSSDTEPGQFYIFNTKKQKLKPLIEAKPWLNKKLLSEQTPFTFKNRDGITLHGYLTLKNRNKKNNSLVVMPHGFQHGSRDYWRYTDEVQLLASRGYAVLQVNYRGSGGYGDHFEKSGDKHLGDLIQNDIIDATHWAINQEIIDKEKICIFGISLSGYSALKAPTIEPNLYQCAIGYAGIYDLSLLLTDSTMKKYQAGVNFLNEKLGKDIGKLKSTSPAYIANRINIPVFLAHGEDDNHADVKNFEIMKKSLKKVNNPAELLLIDDESHGFYKQESRQEFYEKLLTFLDKHIGDKKIASQ